MATSFPSWQFLDTFNCRHFAIGKEARRPALDWGSVDKLVSLGRQIAKREKEVLQQELEPWRCGSLGVDPADSDWQEFRPLRLNREEDWSDWFAHLLQASQSGRLAANVLGIRDEPIALARPRVKREDPTNDGDFRADLVAHWSDGTGATIEVKIWDQAFYKTPATIEGIHKKHSEVTSWTDFVLLPGDQRAAWEKAFEDSPTNLAAIRVVTWESVAVALRRELLGNHESAESPIWQAFAHAFCGAIEQKLLGLQPLVANRRPFSFRSAMGRMAIISEAKK